MPRADVPNGAKDVGRRRADGGQEPGGIIGWDGKNHRVCLNRVGPDHMLSPVGRIEQILTPTPGADTPHLNFLPQAGPESLRERSDNLFGARDEGDERRVRTTIGESLGMAPGPLPLCSSFW